jgi:hypothetical protein
VAVVYWFSDGGGVGVVKGGPTGKVPIPTLLVRWIRSQSPDLIVYGGDVYRNGRPDEFAQFLKQMGGNVALMCATPGNHDWNDAGDVGDKGRIPRGYEAFWSSHPESKQPIDGSKEGAARYDHFIDLKGWRLIFVDTGDYNLFPWPGGDPDRKTWLQDVLKPGRSNILFAHHSRVSCGHHGHNSKLQELWISLFDASGPRVACTIAGHDHNVNIYRPRSKDDPEGKSVRFSRGIHVVVNGAGGEGHYLCGTGLGGMLRGKPGDVFSDSDNFCITRLHLIDKRTAEVDVVSFGREAKTAPVAVAKSKISLKV